MEFVDLFVSEGVKVLTSSRSAASPAAIASCPGVREQDRARAQPGRGLLPTLPTAEGKHTCTPDKSNKLLRKSFQAQSFRKHFNKRYICNEYVLEIDAGRHDVKTMCSFMEMKLFS